MWKNLRDSCVRKKTEETEIVAEYQAFLFFLHKTDFTGPVTPELDRDPRLHRRLIGAEGESAPCTFAGIPGTRFKLQPVSEYLGLFYSKYTGRFK
ncbi:Leucine aminopeptidase 2, partial [Clarias magur]